MITTIESIVEESKIKLMSQELPLIIMGVAAKRLVIDFPKKLNVISVTKDMFIDPSLCKNHLQISIDDLDTDEKEYPSYTYAEKEHIQQVIEFAKQNKPIHIIHCHAGLSRSPAMAYAIFRSEGMSKDEAMKKVLRINPYAFPNKRIVKFTDEMFNEIPKTTNVANP